ncbi:helix-turn-helix domain-containing protein [Gluconobacter morbifer]|uniref:helix-turn-helix domain-containing protein n=1 Tax=Gluconobacter morbifer TaxID=479935 RepID=UPI00158548D2|nr:helix-turn-helix transcriptional regulator [Gluconobacter morbifer]
MTTPKPSRKKSPTPASIAMGQRIRTQREHLGFTQAKLAAMLGVTVNAIAQYETGRASPRRERVPALLEALGKSIGWLLTGDDPVEAVKAQTEQEQTILLKARELSPDAQDILIKMIDALKK